MTIAGTAACIFGTGPISGLMYYDEANRQIHSFAPYASGGDNWYLIETR